MTKRTATRAALKGRCASNADALALQSADASRLSRLVTRRQRRPLVAPKYLAGKSLERVLTVLESHRLCEKKRYDSLNAFVAQIGRQMPRLADFNQTKLTNVLLNFVCYIAFLERRIVQATAHAGSFFVTKNRPNQVLEIIHELSVRQVRSLERRSSRSRSSRKKCTLTSPKQEQKPIDSNELAKNFPILNQYIEASQDFSSSYTPTAQNPSYGFSLIECDDFYSNFACDSPFAAAPLSLTAAEESGAPFVAEYCPMYRDFATHDDPVENFELFDFFDFPATASSGSSRDFLAAKDESGADEQALLARFFSSPYFDS